VTDLTPARARFFAVERLLIPKIIDPENIYTNKS
jgi:hypothetical protein